MATKPLVAIVGETGSGKSDLALLLAKKFGGEIIAADSRTIYKGMDIGTAKPSAQDQKTIPHHLLDIVEPGQPFTVADFQSLANKAIADIQARNKRPILVGGSGLYVDSILYDYQFSDTNNEPLRDAQNPRHLAGKSQQNKTMRPNTLVIGMQLPPNTLRQRIEDRITAMLKLGLEDEAKHLGKKYGWDIEPMKTYVPLKHYLEGQETIEQATQRMITKDLQLAKKQRTWFRRNKSIQWLDDPKQAVDIVTTFLNKTI